MSKNYEVKSALNLNNEENYMLDNQQDWEVGQLVIDEADIEKARKVLAASLVEEEIDDKDEHPAIYNGIEWDTLAHLVEVQLYMKKVMGRIEWIDDRMARAKAGDYLPHESWMALVGEKKNLWSKWNQGKTVSQSIVGEEKRLWGIYFNIEDHEQFLKNHLEMSTSIWNTYGRDDEEEEFVSPCEKALDRNDFDWKRITRYLKNSDVVDMLAESHIAEMREYDRDVNVNWFYQDKRMENRQLEMQSLEEYCPF